MCWPQWWEGGLQEQIGGQAPSSMCPAQECVPTPPPAEVLLGGFGTKIKPLVQWGRYAGVEKWGTCVGMRVCVGWGRRGLGCSALKRR